MVWPVGHGIVYGMAWRASRGKAWPGGHRMVYDIWYGLSGIVLYMVWPGEQ